ncbi:hypothetical protein ASG89_15575 [Paenibacillus sp. Soil766]|uniref:hypothetical protein n=1 Tax=Paenibacillus sp. Soil766 TaxID=1736404 RepID=UPI00070AC6B4|nr:hypothetical protein [Paenibacillus sp. Soil766]KRF09636.1 hypothetical protein ASG89_15575 [Paenibacillus sp. Soil766]
MSYGNRDIAMCDIIGFRQFIEQTELQEAVERFQRLKRDAIDQATNQRVHTINGQGEYRLQIEVVNSVIFSDTLLMWVDVAEENHDTIVPVANFFDAIGALMAYFSKFGPAISCRCKLW